MGLQASMRAGVKNTAKDAAFTYVLPRVYEQAVRETAVQPNKAVFVAQSAETLPDNFALVYARLRDVYGFDVQFISLRLQDGYAAYLRNCMDMLREAASARVIFLDDASAPVSCVNLREETTVVQLWHACGAFKKFGMSTAEKRFGGTRAEKERHPFYENLSLVTVSAPEIRWAYTEAMALDATPDVVQPLGVSRTDVYFDEGFVAASREFVRSRVPQLGERRLLLYAPTFRGTSDRASGPDAIDWRQLKRAIGEDWFVVVKHHPFVKNPAPIPADCDDFACFAPDAAIDELLCAADACVTDYSSIVFEYALLDRPLAFFAYDLDDYNDWRGFYYDYADMTPGPVLRTTAELADYIAHVDERFDAAELAAFREKFMSACDGQATTRVCDWVMERCKREGARKMPSISRKPGRQMLRGLSDEQRERLFVREPKRWDLFARKCSVWKQAAEAPVYDGALVLPLRPIPAEELRAPISNIACRGGVCASDGTFVAGSKRRSGKTVENLECTSAYEVEESAVAYRDERALFGGFLYRHFGHEIVDGITRLWRAVGRDDFDKVVFLEFPYDFPSVFDPMGFIDLLGIPPEKIEVIQQPTRFRELIVPDDTFRCFVGYLPEYVDLCHYIRDRVLAGGRGDARKIYLARKALKHVEPGGDEKQRSYLNEEFYQRFFERRGYTSVYLEELSVEEQIRAIASAEEIVSVVGTMSHLLLFARDDVQATLLVRENPSEPQMYIERACGLTPYYIDACSNPLPVRHERGPFLFMPNRFLRAYAEARGWHCDEEEMHVSEEEHQKLVYGFMQTWAKTYRQPNAAATYLNTRTMFDVIARMNDALYDDTFDENAYRAADDLHYAALAIRALTHSPLRGAVPALRKLRK